MHARLIPLRRRRIRATALSRQHLPVPDSTGAHRKGRRRSTVLPRECIAVHRVAGPVGCSRRSTLGPAATWTVPPAPLRPLPSAASRRRISRRRRRIGDLLSNAPSVLQFGPNNFVVLGLGHGHRLDVEVQDQLVEGRRQELCRRTLAASERQTATTRPGVRQTSRRTAALNVGGPPMTDRIADPWG